MIIRASAALLLVQASSAMAAQHDATAGPIQGSAGEVFEGAMPFADTARAVALPAGRWQVVAQVEEQGPDALVVLSRTEGDHLRGLVWARSAADPIDPGTWCAGGEVRQDLEPLRAGGGQEGCLWVRQWSPAGSPEDLEEYWRQAFDRIEQSGAEVPTALIAAGYHVTDAAPSLTVEYTFDADDVTAQEAIAWAREWQDAVVAAYRGKPAEAPAPDWPTR